MDHSDINDQEILNQFNFDQLETLEKIFEEKFKHMEEKDMDYKDMEYVLQLIKKKQWNDMWPYVEKVNETYFKELILSLILKAKEQMNKGPNYYQHLNRNDFDSDMDYLEARVRAGIQAGYTFTKCRDHWFDDFEKALYKASDEEASSSPSSM